MGLFSKDNEQKIVQLFRRGDASAMDCLYANFADYLTGVAARYITDDDDLKDILQEAFIKIFTTIDTFEYRGRGSLRGWMSRIVVNECLQALRRRQRSPILALADEPPDVADTPESDPEADGITGEELTHLIRQLPDGYRTVLNLYAIEGKSHKEIAEMLGIKPDTSASQFHRAKNMLARIINDYKHHRS